MLVLWTFYLILFFLNSTYLLTSLILLELGTFIIFMVVSFSTSSFYLSNTVILILFVVFVIEGVIAMCGLVMLVSFSGSDYISSSSIMKI